MNTFPQDSSYSDREININPTDVFNLKINPEGFIDYANHRFCEVSGYEEYELIGEPLDILKHPDMPQLFFEVLNERLHKREPMRMFIKFQSKDGRPFWVLMDFETKTDNNDNIVAHYAKGKAAPRYGVFKMESLNKILTKIESKTHSTDASKRYLIGYLEERKMTYNKYIDEICSYREEEFAIPESPQTKTSDIMDTDILNNNIHYDMPVNSKIMHDTERINKLKNVIPHASEYSHGHYYNANFNKKKKKSLMKKLFGK